MINKRRILKVMLMASLMTILSVNICFADGPLEKFAQLMKANDEMAWGVLGPILIIGATVILILGILVLVSALGFITLKALTQYFGKGKVGAQELKLFGIGMIIGLLVTGGGWLSFVKLWDRVVVQPAQEILQQEQSLEWSDEMRIGKIENEMKFGNVEGRV